MAANVKFFRGQRSRYFENEIMAEKYQNGIFFSEDSAEIFVNGISYGGGIKDVLVKEVNGQEQLVIITSSGKEHKIPLANLLPSEVGEMVSGLCGSLVAKEYFVSAEEADVKYLWDSEANDGVGGYREADTTKGERGTHISVIENEETVYYKVEKFVRATHVFDSTTNSYRVAEENETAIYSFYGKNFLVHEVDENKLAVREIDANATKLQKDIIVAGLDGQFGAGGYVNTNVIPAGTDIYTILQNILCKELYASPTSTNGTITASITAPVVTLDNTGTVEVGTLVKMTSATVGNSTVSTTSNKVTGMEYGYSSADDDTVDSTNKSIEKTWTTRATGGNYTMSATVSGFDADTVTNVQTVPSTVNAQSMEETTLGCVAEGSNTITVSVTGDTFTGSIDGIDSVYHCSNLGNTDASKKTTAVPAQTDKVSNAPTNSKTITITGKYYYYVSFIPSESKDATDLITEDNIKNSSNLIKKEFISSTITQDLTFSNGGFHVIACPPSTSLTQVQNSFGSGDLLPNFGSGESVSMTIGGNLAADYTVYYTHSAGDGTVLYKNVKITK